MMEVRPRTFSALLRAVALKCAVAWLAVCAAAAGSGASASDARSRDEIVVVSSRRIGTRCDASTIAAGLDCRRYAQIDRGNGTVRTWRQISLRDALDGDRVMPTIVYIHGNRMSSGTAMSHGLSVYRSMQTQLPENAAVRFVIWSWPSEQVRGVVKDYKVKAARTGPVGWQVAWALNRLPAETPLAVIGYSYGARVATGALHLLAGGSLNGRTVPQLKPDRAPVQAVLLAAALDADWLRPRGYHGRALELVEHLSLITNRRDPAMRFYHLTTDRDVRALGYAGPAGWSSIRREFDVDVDAYDATDNVGRHHALHVYLRSSPQLARAWHSLNDLTPAEPARETPQIATRAAQPAAPAQGG